MVQQDVADDYVLATGETYSVREFAQRAFAVVGRQLEWRGSGTEEIAVDARTGETVVAVDPRYFRPTEVDLLLGRRLQSPKRSRVGDTPPPSTNSSARWSRWISPPQVRLLAAVARLKP
jgi:GDPmannose 4,6-dehydratase